MKKWYYQIGRGGGGRRKDWRGGGGYTVGEKRKRKGVKTFLMLSFILPLTNSAMGILPEKPAAQYPSTRQ